MLLRVSLFCSQFRAARGKMRIIILALSTILLLASCLNRSADVLQRGGSVGGASDEQPQKILTESKDLAKLLDSASAKEAFADYVRRLKGSWALSYMMTTGTIRGLDHAFCLNGEIRKETEPSDESDAVHADLCNKYSLEERGALKAFLEQW